MDFDEIDNPIDSDYSIQQSAGYIFVHLLIVQMVYIIMCLILVIIGDKTSSVVKVPGFNISVLDVFLILTGAVVNFVYFLITFIKWQLTKFRISSSRLHFHQGFSLRKSKSVDLSDIEHGAVHATSLNNRLNYGAVVVYLRSRNKPVVLKGVPYPIRFLAQLKVRMAIGRA